MEKILEVSDAYKELIYAFRFGTSDKCLHLTQQQLDRISYLSTLVAHKDDFLSIQNENNEFVLNPLIYYNWFMAIFDSMMSEQPYTLFNKLPEDENILDTLQLFDYLGVESFSLPLLKDEYWNSINNDNTKRHIEYHRANLPEARNTAAEFIVALSKNEYDLHDLFTVSHIFSLIMIIFTNPNVFSSRFCHHTLTIVKEYCWAFFSEKQRNQLPNMRKIAQNGQMDSWIYFYENDQSLPENFDNAFAWKGVYKLVKEIETNYSGQYPRILVIFGHSRRGKSALLNVMFNRTVPSHLPEYTATSRELSMIENCNDKNVYMSDAQSARSGRFNTLPKRPNVDKFKHRFGPKAQKYR